MSICVQMKRVMAHTRCCRRKTNGGCPVCKQLIALCCYHAKHCAETKCPVPFCVTIKQKLQQQQLQQRMAQSYMMSRRMAAMRGGAYPTPTPAAPSAPVYQTTPSASNIDPSPGKPAMAAASPAAASGNPTVPGTVQTGTVVLIPQQRPSLDPSPVIRPQEGGTAGSVDIARNLLALQQQQQQQRLPSVQQNKTVVLSGGPGPAAVVQSQAGAGTLMLGGPAPGAAVVQSQAGGAGTLMLGAGDTLIRLPTPDTFSAATGQPQQVGRFRALF